MSIGLMVSSSLRYSIGVRRRGRRQKGARAGDRPDTEGALRTGTRKAWSLPLRPGSRRLRAHSMTDADGYAGASLEGTGGRETPPIRVSRLLTIKDLAEQLRIKSGTLYTWAAQGKIPSRKIHGLVRFVPLEIDRWLASFSPPQSTPLQLETRRLDHTDLDRLIASAKRAVYTFGHGETITPSPIGKE
jgi:excisionase family DNA binding protein